MFFKKIIYAISKANIYHPSFHKKKNELKLIQRQKEYCVE